MEPAKAKIGRLLPLLLGVGILLSACGPVRPIRELRIVETLGFDRAERGVTLSAQADGIDTPLRQTAASALLAMDQMRGQAASEALFFSHTQFLLLGQALAEEDLAPTLDLVARSADMRLRTPIFILYGGEACEMVSAGSDDRTVTGMLTALRQDGERQGVCRAFSCGEILRALSERGAALAAACRREDDHLAVFGYGVLKDGRLVGWIPAPEAQAAGLLMGLPERGDLALEGATLTLEGCETEIRPRWEGAALTGLDISLSLRAALSETAGQPGITEGARRRALEAALAETVQRRAEAVLRRMQALGADALDLGGAIARENPGKWAAIRSDWNTRFPALPFHVAVTAELDRTRDLRSPLNLGGAP